MPYESPQEFYRSRMRSVDRRRLLTPRSTGEILDLATRLYQRLALPLLRLTFPPMLFCFLGLIFFQGFVLPGLWLTSSPDDYTAQVGEVAIAFAVWLLVAVPVFAVGLGYATALSGRLVSGYILSQEVNLKEAVESAKTGAMTTAKLLFRIVLRATAVLIFAGGLLLYSAYLESSGAGSSAALDFASVLAFIAFLAGIVAMPIMINIDGLAPVVAIVEGVSSKDALRRSRLLIRRQRHIPDGYQALFLTWFICLITWGVLNTGIKTVLSMSGVSEWAESIGGRSIAMAVLVEGLSALPLFLALWLLVPFLSCSLVTIYFDRRIRVEGFDIETMARDVLEGTEEADLRL